MSINIWSKPLNMDTFQLYGARYYQGVPTWSEFFETIKIFSLNSRLLVSKHNGLQTLNICRILNSYVLLGNVFPGNSLARLAFFISNPIIYPELKTLLYFMKRLPNRIPEVNLSEIPLRQPLLDQLDSV